MGFAQILALSALASMGTGDFLEGLPPPPGMERDGQVAVYPPERLWDYIDGAAELYIDYGVEETATVAFKRSRADLPEIVIDLHRMADPKGAFGLFSAEEIRGAEDAGLGSASIWTAGFLVFRKGRYYARVVSEVSKDSTIACVAALADRLPSEEESFPILDLFPADGRIASKDGYVARAFLGIRGFDDLWTASYADSTGEYRLILRGNRLPLREKDLEGVGRIASVPTDESPIQMIELPGDRALILFYVRKCYYLSGYYGRKPDAAMIKRIALWVDGLPKMP